MKKEAGFTLLEILLAIAVLSVMMLLIFTLTTESTNTIDRVMAEDREFMQVETAMAIIDRDFSNIYNPLYFEVEKKNTTEDGQAYKEESGYQNFDGETYRGKIIPVINTADKEQLSFMTAGHQRRIENAKQSNYAWVRYSLESVPAEERKEKAKETFRLLRQYTADNPYSNDLDWEKVKAHILLDNLSKLTFSYWDSKKKAYISSLADLSENQKTSLIMRLEFTWIDRNDLENQVVRTFRVLQVPYDSSNEVNQKAKKVTLDNGEKATESTESGDGNESED